MLVHLSLLVLIPNLHRNICRPGRYVIHGVELLHEAPRLVVEAVEPLGAYRVDVSDLPVRVVVDKGPS